MKRCNGRPIPQLEQLSTQQLQKILQQSVEPDSQIDEAVIEAVLELLAAREEMVPLTPTEQALQILKTRFNTPDGAGQALYPEAPLSVRVQKTTKAPKPHGRPLWRRAVSFAACIAIIFTGIISAKAVSASLLGGIATWDEELLHFHTPETIPTYQMQMDTAMLEELDPEIAHGLEVTGIPPQLLPTFIPDGFSLLRVETGHNLLLDVIALVYVNEAKQVLMITVEDWKMPEHISDGFFEKDDGPVKTHISNGRQYYLFTNCGTRNAAWNDGRYLICVSIQTSEEDLIQVIESIREG